MKVGIITMHKVLNYGSALQAYALQQKLMAMGGGNDIELIDYQYPKPKVKAFSIKNTVINFFVFLRNAVIGFPTQRKRKKFASFYDKNFRLSKKFYTEESIKSVPPEYDIYVTGSDQVWNPKHAGNDTNFLLSFVPAGKKKVSYASSFATNDIDPVYSVTYAALLSQYDAISVRETSGIQIVQKLTGKVAQVCCDPTLLLDKSEWTKLALQSNIKIKYKYILVYILSYMCNPYPYIESIIKSVQQTLGYKIIYLVGRKEDAFKPNSRLIKSAGPAEFVYLFQNAEFIITTSFHGTAFSCIFNKPVIGAVSKADRSDCRIQSLLTSVGAERSIFDFKDEVNLTKDNLLSLRCDELRLKEIISSSIEYLKQNVS